MLAIRNRIQNKVILAVMAIAAFLGIAQPRMATNETGSMMNALGAVLGGVVVFVVGLSLAATVLTAASTAGASTAMGSFSNAKSINDLLPLIFYVGLMVVGIGLMITGGAGMAGRGPLK